MERIQRGDEGGERGDIFSNLLHAKQLETGEPYNQRELMGEAILLLVAGSDTTSTALTVIIWHHMANPETLQKLTSEICGTFSSVEATTYHMRSDLFTYIKLKLSFTNPEMELQDGFDVEDTFVALKPKVRVQVAKV
ncbi:hypothetical protein VC83_06521 [Pseudogymnoascus destructans]|uniref:Uncharacterized protein n=1 Tax=Pseudogymnoascus destructans TaxID=655981 RepID=A0A177A9C7_9PEZI|nr:uncharacterized protein VC83_06521 [Pseudogymnoascus destructans]OAF58350.1 hypothetical protein VC83_06521 [Pseudogymnoascus destructans]